MNSKIKTIIVLIGFVLSLVGLVLIYRDFSNQTVEILPISLFVLSISVSFKILAKTKHKSRKFKLHKFTEED